MESLPYVRVLRASNGWVLDCHSEGSFGGPEVRLFTFEEDDADGEANAFADALTEIDRQIGVSSDLSAHPFGAARIAINILGVVRE
tara:strand:- start:20883 stop:21140 length:258 start_codon:yes stop_codon:yes gene_type:complete